MALRGLAAEQELQRLSRFPDGCPIHRITAL